MKLLSTVKRRCEWCYYVRRRGYLYVYCKMHGRHKQRQGTRLGRKHVVNKRKYKGWFSSNAYIDANYDALEVIECDDGSTQLALLCEDDVEDGENMRDLFCNHHRLGQHQHLSDTQCDECNHTNLTWNEQFKLFNQAMNQMQHIQKT